MSGRTRIVTIVALLAAGPLSAAPPAAGLAEALLAAPSAEARERILRAEPHAVTTALFEELMARGVRSASAGLPGAGEAFAAAQSVAEALGNDALVATALAHVGLAHVQRGELAPAADAQRRAEDLAQRAGDPRALAYVWSRGAELYLQRGEYAQARAYLERAEAAFAELHDATESARSLSHLARLAYYEGRYAEALERWRAACEAVKGLPASTLGVRCLSGIGLAHWNMGDNQRALEFYQRALTQAEQVGDRAGVVDSLDKIADVHRAHGDFGQALVYGGRARALAREVGRRPLEGELISTLAATHHAAGDLEEAARGYREALGIASEVGSRGLEMFATSGLANVELEQGRLEESSAHHARTLELAEGSGAERYVAEGLVGLAEVHLLRGDPGQAATLARRAADVARRIGGRELLWPAQVVLARALRATGERDRALETIDEAVATVESLRGDSVEPIRHGFLARKVQPYHEAMELCLERGEVDRALAYAERAKARALFDLVSARGSKPPRRLSADESAREQETLARLRDLNVQIQRALLERDPSRERLATLYAARQRARLDYEAFESLLHSTHPELRRRQGHVPAWDPAGLPLDTRMAALEFVVTARRTHVFVLTRDDAVAPPRIETYAIEASRDQLRGQVQQFRDQVARRDLGFAEPARRLHDLLLRGAGRALAARHTLAVVPDDILWELPFEALRAADGRYLMESRALFLTPSLSLLGELAAEGGRRTSEPVGRRRLLALGNPLLTGATRPRPTEVTRAMSLDPLPEAETEVRALGRLYGPARSHVYVGRHATERALKAGAGRHDVIHVAAHAVLDDEQPFYSSVMLARDGDDDGLLEAWEVRDMDLHADLVVLSACQTGRGRVTPGEGVIGLSWALFAAGVPAAVVSRWNVESTSTAEMMVEFHRQLLPPDASKAEALRRAAQKLLRTERFRHPYYWAGFVALGAAGP